MENLINGIGKRKTSVAKVFLKEGIGKIIVNEKNWEDFFAGIDEEKELIKKPFLLLKLTTEYDLIIKVKGGGISSQLDAIKLAISKALCKVSNEYRPILNQNLLLRRDSRIKERRKYGLKKARKASQYSKR
jgi:small subunit ribosomal protein S9